MCDGALPPAPPDLDRKVGRDFTALVQMVTDTTLALEEKVCRELETFRPEVIVSDSICFWGKLFAGKLGVPYVCSTTTFAFNQHSAQRMKPTAGEMLRSLVGTPRVGRCMALLRRHGYPVKGLLDLIQNDNETDTIVYTSRAFQPMAETFSDRYAFVGPSLPERALAEQPPKARPLVYISLGTVMNRQADFYRSCIAALEKEPLDVVMSVGEGVDPASLSLAPANFRIERRVDQLAVLARADVFLTHCGMNSANEAIWFGVPTVLYPQQSEEAAVADCRGCRLAKTRRHTAFGEGNRAAQVLLVGEGPGREEDLQGRPFVGPAGRLLDRMLAAVGLDRETVYIANVVK